MEYLSHLNSKRNFYHQNILTGSSSKLYSFAKSYSEDLPWEHCEETTNDMTPHRGTTSRMKDVTEYVVLVYYLGLCGDWEEISLFALSEWWMLTGPGWRGKMRGSWLVLIMTWPEL